MIFSPRRLYHKINLTPVEVVRALFKSNITKNQPSPARQFEYFLNPCPIYHKANPSPAR